MSVSFEGSHFRNQRSCRANVSRTHGESPIYGHGPAHQRSGRRGGAPAHCLRLIRKDAEELLLFTSDPSGIGRTAYFPGHPPVYIPCGGVRAHREKHDVILEEDRRAASDFWRDMATTAPWSKRFACAMVTSRRVARGTVSEAHVSATCMSGARKQVYFCSPRTPLRPHYLAGIAD